MTEVGTAELLTITTEIAVEAAALAARYRSEGVTIAAAKSAPEDVVTIADRATEDFIRARLAELRPGDGFFGEESAASESSTGLTWVVDPIDGTVNYLYGLPNYAVSIAVVEGDPDPKTWTALAGAVASEGTGTLHTASRGGGAFENGKTIQVNRDVTLPLALVATGFSYSSERRLRQGAVINQLVGTVRDIRRFGSAALDLTTLASGRIDAYYEVGLNPWDMAAGALIAEEAGASVTGLHGGAGDRDFLLAAHPSIAEPLRELLIELDAANV